MIKNILILSGGKSSEHDISLISKDYISLNLTNVKDIKVTSVILPKDGSLPIGLDFTNFDYIIPCFHGYPGETGDIQSLLALHSKPYLGSNSEAHKSCFNKITAKLYFDSLSIPNTPFIHGHIDDSSFAERSLLFFKKYTSGVFVKASRQGSSIGCSPANTQQELTSALKKCFKYDSYLLIEKSVKARELEVAVFEYKGRIHITEPGEIKTPDTDFYSYEEKYSQASQSKTIIKANVPSAQVQIIKESARKVFQELELKDLARIDFFLTDQDEVLLNEINTFPGLTPISMFPKMMEAYGVQFQDFLVDRIFNS
jgi:D-alanine-D-alanine ligase